jgi:predicted nuclease of predicted toxin-antitoxin system
MKFKLDENFGPTIQHVFQQRGLDCHTVQEENLHGAVDEEVLKAAVAEGRILVTMDRDFSNVLRYPPGQTAGIAVISPPGKASRALLRALVEVFVEELQKQAIRGRLWIVEPGRIREHEPDELPGWEEDEEEP